MPLADDVQAYVAEVMAAMLSSHGLLTASGTVATSPSQVSTDPLTVVLDGGSVAVPAKQIRAFPVFPEMRVGLVRIGVDWVVLGSFTNPGAGTGQQRLTVGADVPIELVAYGIQVAMLMYDTDKTSGLEVGYFFIGVSNSLDAGSNEKVMLFGSVKYPIAGDPTSATSVIVKTAHQINMNGFTWFKDFAVQIQGSVPSFKVDSPDVLFQAPGGRVEFTTDVDDMFLDAKSVWVHDRLLPNNHRTLEADGTLTFNTLGTANQLTGFAFTDLVKESAGTRMRVRLTGTGFRDCAAYTRLHIGVKITNNTSGVNTFHDIARAGLSTNLNRYTGLGGIKTLAAVPAGSYSMELFFRMSTAAGEFKVGGAEDSWFMEWEEIW